MLLQGTVGNVQRVVDHFLYVFNGRRSGMSGKPSLDSLPEGGLINAEEVLVAHAELVSDFDVGENFKVNQVLFHFCCVHF